MSRYPVIQADTLDDYQKLVEPAMEQVFANVPQLEYKTADGLLYGPYAPIFYTPDLIEPLLTLASAVTRQKRFMPREREQSILAILAVYDVPYVLYTHSEIALVAGLSKEQVQQAVHGKVPDGLSEEEAMVYSLSLKLASIRGPLDQADFGKTENVFGRERIAGLAHIVSGYIYAAMLTNVADSGVPERKDGVFLATKNPAFG